MRKDCTCQGNNENCYRCDGKGYYDEKDLQPLARIPFARRPTKQNLSKKIKVCPHCREEVWANKLESHIFKAHGITRINKTFLIKCPQCNSMVRNDRLKKHINKVHKKLSNASTIQKITQSQKISAVNKDLLNIHINNCPKKLLTIQTKKGSEVKKQEKRLFDNSSQVPKDIDGSKGWHTYRDGGKFGSFPSFDPMDDESFPD